MSFVTLKPGSELPMHHHLHEQLGWVLEGDFDMAIGDETRRVREGDTYLIPGGTLHGVPKVHAPSRVLDVFIPSRDEYR